MVAGGLLVVLILVPVLAHYLLPRDCDTVTHKYPLTSLSFCNTVIAIGSTQMANILSNEKQVAVIAGLAEGSGIRQIERITGAHRDTVMRLGIRIGQSSNRAGV